ncbi:hypothetical protein EBT16_08260, partial [bacterium]|nr:hypothetical protein [bacterium]
MKVVLPNRDRRRRAEPQGEDPGRGRKASSALQPDRRRRGPLQRREPDDPSRRKATVSTEISLEIPEGFYGRVAPRSGLASKHGVDVLAGVVDSSYRGEVKVVLLNTDRSNTFFVE